MRAGAACVVACAVAAWAGGPPVRGADAPRVDREHWTADASLGASLKWVLIRNPHGDVRVRRAEDGVIEVSGTRQPLSPGEAHVGLGIERLGDALLVAVAYPPGRRALTQPDQGVTDRMDVTVFVPDGVAVDAESQRGVVEARRLRGPVAARTLDGDILVWAWGPIRASSEAGRVEAHLQPPGPSGGTSVLESGAGDVIVVLPREADFEIRARSGGGLEAGVPGETTRSGDVERFRGGSGAGRGLVVAASETGSVTLRTQE